MKKIEFIFANFAICFLLTACSIPPSENNRLVAEVDGQLILVDEFPLTAEEMALEEEWSNNSLSSSMRLHDDDVLFDVVNVCLDDTTRYQTKVPLVWFYTTMLDNQHWGNAAYDIFIKDGETWLTIYEYRGYKHNSLRLLDAVQTYELTYQIKRSKKSDGTYVIETENNLYTYEPDGMTCVWSEKKGVFLPVPTPAAAPALYGWEVAPKYHEVATRLIEK